MDGHILVPSVLVNAAGIHNDQLLVRVTDDSMRDIFDTNIKGPLHTCRAFTKMVLKQRRAARKYGKESNDVSIINIGSVVGSAGNVGQVVYSASKSALVGLSKSLAKELGPKGIRVNLVEPGYVDVGMTSSLGSEFIDDVERRTALRRLGTPEDISNLVTFLAGQESSFLTGQTIRIDGGLQL
eukprot:g4935.t1